MADEKWVVQSYAFANSKDYEKAKKEQETIAYIKANTDLSQVKVVAKLYVSLVEKETFDTIVGYSFLEELRQQIIASNLVTLDALPPIPVKVKGMTKESVANDRADRYKALYEKSDSKRRISICANIFLVIIIVVMMTLTIMTSKNADTKTENEVLDKYSSWKQELQQKEDELNQREKQLNILEDKEKYNTLLR